MAQSVCARESAAGRFDHRNVRIPDHVSSIPRMTLVIRNQAGTLHSADGVIRLRFADLLRVGEEGFKG